MGEATVQEGVGAKVGFRVRGVYQATMFLLVLDELVSRDGARFATQSARRITVFMSLTSFLGSPRISGRPLMFIHDVSSSQVRWFFSAA
jgi:hypothetical protein